MSHTKRHAKRLLGYGRISTEAQDLTRQRQALKAYGCKVIFEDRASGKSLAGRPELTHALDELRPGDCLVLAEWVGGFNVIPRSSAVRFTSVRM